MLISEEKGFLYYHLYKVAGTSIRNSLLPYCSRRVAAMQNINYGLRTFGIKIIDNPLYQFHPDLNDVKSLLGEEFYKYYRFTFVREPLDWQKSLYFFTKKNSRHHQHSSVKSMDFDSYIDWRIENDLKLQSDLIYDGNECLVNEIYKFEEINEAFDKIKSKFSLSTVLKHKNIAGKGKTIALSNSMKIKFLDAFEDDYRKLGYTPSM